MHRPSVLCPIDFSEGSRGALRYAAALAEHFYATLSVLTVDDPFLVQAATASFGAVAMRQLTEEALQTFVKSAFPAALPPLAELKPLIRVGQAAPEILQAADAEHADVIVMSTHGASGVRKLLFGSTTERVLRDAIVPVIVTPGSNHGPESVESWIRGIRTVLVPVDFSEFSPHQVRVAQGLAEGVDASLVVVHVIEPLASPDHFRRMASAVDAVRAANARTRLDALLHEAPSRLRHTTDIAHGDAAGEIARLAREHEAGAIVMALHTSPQTGRRIGTITYRLLCQTPAVVIALPPASAARTLPTAAGRYAASTAGSVRELSS